MRAMPWIAVAAAIALTSCSAEKSTTRQLTERERDSVIAHSILPGASVVGRALDVSDRAAARAAKMGAATDSLFH